MFDFLKAYPSVTMEQYMWHMTVPQIALAKHDSTHVVYLSDEEAARRNTKVINSAEDLMNDLGFPINVKE